MFTHSVTLYLSSVFIWGSTFFAIRFQLGEVAPELSIAYRFTIAAVLLFGWCILRGLPLGFGLRQHLWMGLQGLLLFCLNYLVIYWATGQLTSGLIAVVFSTIVLMNIANSAVFFRKRVDPPMVAGALMGLAGIALVFQPEFSGVGRGTVSAAGVGFSLLGTFVASLGNMVSVRNQRQHLPVVQSNAWGMAYGAAILLTYAVIREVPFTIDTSREYTLSLLYLALFGSVLAFGSYLTLLGRIGPERAAYAMVLFPLVALGISTLFEGYRWTPGAVAGVGLVIAGNLLILMPGERLSRIFRNRWMGPGV